MFHLGAITDELSKDIVQALDIAQRCGLKGVELHTVWGSNIECLGYAQIDRLKTLLDSQGLHVCCLSSTVFLRCHLDNRTDPISPIQGFASMDGSYAVHLEALERCLQIASTLSAPLIRIFGFWNPGMAPDEACYHAAAEKLVRAAHMAESAGITLALENCPYTGFCRGRQTANLVALVDSPRLQMLWDPANALRCGEEDYLAAYDLIRPFLAHVHAKDILISPNLERGRAYVLMGTGQMDWEGIIRHLASDGYRGVVSVEPHCLGPDGTPESAARTAVQALQRIMADILDNPAAQGDGDD
jgi:sugar phosphate isomerase/epimerase